MPRYLSEHGVPHLIPVVATNVGELWTRLGDFTVTVYPFVTGKSGYEVPLTATSWHDFGKTLRRLHTLNAPPESGRLCRESTTQAGGSRSERVVHDVAIFCDELVRGVGSEAERERSLGYLKANFRPGGTVDRAYAVRLSSGA